MFQTSSNWVKKKLHVCMPETNFLVFCPKALLLNTVVNFIDLLWLVISCHHGLRTPYEAFFHWNQELLDLPRKNWAGKIWGFGVFLAELSAPILVQWVPCPCFSLFNHYFYKKTKTFYIHIPNSYLGFRFEFWPQRIRNLTFVCPGLPSIPVR